MQRPLSIGTTYVSQDSYSQTLHLLVRCSIGNRWGGAGVLPSTHITYAGPSKNRIGLCYITSSAIEDSLNWHLQPLGKLHSPRAAPARNGKPPLTILYLENRGKDHQKLKWTQWHIIVTVIITWHFYSMR